MLNIPTPLWHHRSDPYGSPPSDPHGDPILERLVSVDVCGSAARLTGTEQQALATRFAGTAIPAGLRCSLVTHHRSGHLALAAPPESPTPGSTGLVRWLSWGQGRRRFIDVARCDSPPEQATRYGRTTCFLPRGHAGLHSFDYHPDLAWPLRLQTCDQASWHAPHPAATYACERSPVS